MPNCCRLVICVYRKNWLTIQTVRISNRSYETSGRKIQNDWLEQSVCADLGHCRRTVVSAIYGVFLIHTHIEQVVQKMSIQVVCVLVLLLCFWYLCFFLLQKVYIFFSFLVWMVSQFLLNIFHTNPAANKQKGDTSTM